MQLTKYQISVIGERLPAILHAARAKEARIHSIGIGRKVVGDSLSENHAIVFFVTSKGGPPDPVVTPPSLKFFIDANPVNVDTDIVETSMPTFTYCFKQRPAEGGNCVATAGTGLRGTLGGAIVGPDKKHYLVSAAHLLTRFGTKPVDTDVLQPSDDANATIGKLTRLGPDWPPFGGDMDADVALAYVPGGSADISYEIAGIGEFAGTRTPAEKMDILVRGAETGEVKEGRIIYVKCATTVHYRQNDYTFRNVFFTSLISTYGDSGALAIEKAAEEPSKTVGLLFAHSDKYTMFADVDDCTEVLKISGWYWGKPPA